MELTGTCFVVAPIGEPDSETRKRSDQILKHLIKPAVKKCGYDAIRADEISEPGKITSQVIQHIINDPLVIADLTEHNPNVFYEIAIRHVYGKPFVQIMQTDEHLPFDLADMRTIFVDHHDLDSVEQADAAIVEQIKALQRDSSRIQTPISAAIGLQALQVLMQSKDPEQRSIADVLSAIQDMRNSILGAISLPLRDMEKFLGTYGRHGDRAQAYEFLSSRYGWGYDDLSVTGIIDPQGSITIERQISVTARSLLQKLEQSLNVRPAEHEVQTLAIDNLDVFSRTAGTVAKSGNIYPLSDGWVIEVVFDPPVPPSSTVTFVLREKLPPDTYAVGYTRDRLQKDSIKDQWFAWRLDRPTLHFSARVQFPREYKPTGYVHRVFYPPIPKDIANARRHADEETRLEKLLSLNGKVDQSGEPYTLELDVALPILGLLYMIRWDPLACD
jgi:hypothetical protein